MIVPGFDRRVHGVVCSDWSRIGSRMKSRFLEMAASGFIRSWCCLSLSGSMGNPFAAARASSQLRGMLVRPRLLLPPPMSECTPRNQTSGRRFHPGERKVISSLVQRHCVVALANIVRQCKVPAQVEIIAGDPK